MNLRSTLDDLNALIEVIRERGLQPAVIFIDTLARAYAGGEENSSAEMMQFVSVMAALQDALDCAVCVVHHSGKDETRGMRGSSALLAAVDAELELTRISDDDATEPVCTVKSTKQKDGMDGLSWSFRLDLMHVSQLDPDATSLVVHPLTDAPPAAKKRAPRMAPAVRDGLQSLRKAVEEAGQKVTSNHIPNTVLCVQEDKWRDYFYMVTTAENDGRRQAFKRAKDGLIERREAANFGGWWWLTKGDDRDT